MNASVTKTARSGVFAAIQRPAASCSGLSATTSERTCHTAISAGDSAETTRTSAMAGFGQRRMAQPASIATAIHMIWKYLFMSKSTALTTDHVRDDEEREKPGDEEAPRWEVTGGHARDEAQHERDPEVCQVEERDRRWPV